MKTRKSFKEEKPARGSGKKNDGGHRKNALPADKPACSGGKQKRGKRAAHLRRHDVNAKGNLVAISQKQGKHAQHRSPDHGLRPAVDSPDKRKKIRVRYYGHERIGRTRQTKAGSNHCFGREPVACQAVYKASDSIGREIGRVDEARRSGGDESGIDHVKRCARKVESSEVRAEVCRPAKEE